MRAEAHIICADCTRSARRSQGVGDLGRGHKLQRAERRSSGALSWHKVSLLYKLVVIERGQCALQLHGLIDCDGILIANNTAHTIFICAKVRTRLLLYSYYIICACGLNTINQYTLLDVNSFICVLRERHACKILKAFSCATFLGSMLIRLIAEKFIPFCMSCSKVSVCFVEKAKKA